MTNDTTTPRPDDATRDRQQGQQAGEQDRSAMKFEPEAGKNTEFTPEGEQANNEGGEGVEDEAARDAQGVPEAGELEDAERVGREPAKE